MTDYKIAECKAGQQCRRVYLSANKLAKMEQMVFEALKDELPKGTFFLSINLGVEVTIAQEIGEPVFDLQYNIEDKEKEIK